MFIYSFKASSIKFFGILCVALAALITLIAFVPAYAGEQSGGSGSGGGVAVDAPQAESGATVSIRYDKVKSADDAAAFLSQFGWVVDLFQLGHSQPWEGDVESLMIVWVPW